MLLMKWLGVVTAVLAIMALVAAAYGSLRWSAGTRKLLSRLEAGRLPHVITRYDVREIEGLPAPVQRYFRAVLKDGQAIVSAVSVDHTGTFDMSEAAPRWKPFTSKQRVVTRRPGFDWDARIMLLPGVPVRILPEAAWCPTALLPSQGVQWEAVDDRTARATLSDAEISLTMTFRFHADGLIDTVRAESRGRMVGGKSAAATWQGHFWDHALRDGMRVPLEGEVAWILPEGVKPYWRGSITALKYEFEQ